ncbi:hypothetical protein ELI30_09095 [Rhizobium leguminosarum]|uniref:hypothetical protein n=1 Tax=Rhizobium leguminosarum TaxID=384 RepID=UPI00103154AE|nr:hypothetical protein [Rhizobium leguminosarum]TAV48444.1 hypothetical protein ELI32_09550 [Rhizobium leguminosarum]TAV57944.1 hypothetical protein ELI31_09080 [Rhizobium leguminosarum]TAV68885.1 hypothetical protein ELI30_09095 [Rhizobium leguminosarum]
MTGFAAAISDWARETEGAFEAVFHASAQEVFNAVRLSVKDGGRMPIKTGNLRRSFLASTAAMPSIKEGAATFPDMGGASELTIAGAPLGSTVYIGAQAAYAARLNYGFVGEDSLGRTYNQTGYGFIEAVSQRWPQIVAAEEAKVRARFEAGPVPQSV